MLRAVVLLAVTTLRADPGSAFTPVARAPMVRSGAMSSPLVKAQRIVPIFATSAESDKEDLIELVGKLEKEMTTKLEELKLAVAAVEEIEAKVTEKTTSTNESAEGKAKVEAKVDAKPKPKAKAAKKVEDPAKVEAEKAAKSAAAFADAMEKRAESRKRVDAAAAALAALSDGERAQKRAEAEATSAKVFEHYSAATSTLGKDPEIKANARKSPFALTEAEGYVHDQAAVDAAAAAATAAYRMRNLGSRWGDAEIAKFASDVAASPPAPPAPAASAPTIESKSPYVKERAATDATAAAAHAKVETAAAAYESRNVEVLGSRWGTGEVERTKKERNGHDQAAPASSHTEANVNGHVAIMGKDPTIKANARTSPFALTEAEGYVADPAADAAKAAVAKDAYARRELSSRWGAEEVARVDSAAPDAWASEYADAALSKLDELETKYAPEESNKRPRRMSLADKVEQWQKRKFNL